MAQTVAMVRGTASGNANPSTAVTIFTNTGSGAGTRVLCNMLTMDYSGPYTNISSQPYGGTIWIIHNSSGGKSQIIGRYNAANNGLGGSSMSVQYIPSYGMQFNIMPNIVNAPPMPAFAVYGYASGSYGSYGPTGTIYNFSGNSTPAAANFMSMTTVEPTTVTSSNIQKIFNYMPQQFWMGPSDTLAFKAYYYGYYYSGKSQYYGYQTANLGYSFTTITES